MRTRLWLTVLVTLGAGTFCLVSLVLLAMKPHHDLATPVGEDFFTARLLRANGPMGAYRAELVRGDGSKVVTLLDTGSDALWFRQSGHEDLRQPENLSYLSPGTFSVDYMGGSAHGTLSSSEMSILNFTWVQPVGRVQWTTESMNTLDSVLGLGRQCESGKRHSSTCPLEHWRLRKDVFSFFVDKSTGEGLFQAGLEDTTRCESDETLTYAPLLGGDLANMWAVEISFLGRENLRAVFDTGTTNLFLKRRLYEEFIATVGGDCSSGSLPTISIRIGDTEFSMPSSVYATTPRFRDCRFRVQVLDEKFPEDILVGATFLVNFFVVFDRVQQRLGICRPRASPKFLLRVPPSVKEFFSLGL